MAPWANRGSGRRTDGEGATFSSGGESLAGRLYSAAFSHGPAPAVAIIGPETYVPETYVKEQSPIQYARRLTANGYTSLVFDPRFRGESGGEPRCLEDPVTKWYWTERPLGFPATNPRSR